MNGGNLEKTPQKNRSLVYISSKGFHLKLVESINQRTQP